MASSANSFSKTICSICYEDLKPIVEDLQSISICGHVFHELCLQQWFEYCSSGKKWSCPVCKQVCSSGNVCRLYFQSVGEQNDSFPYSRKEVDSCEGDAASLRCEVRRLEGKVSGLNSILERRGNEIKQLNDELYLCKDQLKKENVLRNELAEQKAAIQRLLLVKSEELDTLKLENLRLQDRSMALAKELAALKLVSDLDLEENEVLKLASFGNDANNKDTIDILKKSLVIRNKSYKELMAKCNQLGRGEARSVKKLEKATEKINKLKVRLQELEMAVERKDNEVLWTLKSSSKINNKQFAEDCTIKDITHKMPSKDRLKQQPVSSDHLDPSISLADDKENYSFVNGLCPNSMGGCTSSKASDKERDGCFVIDGTASGLNAPTGASGVLPDAASRNPTCGNVKSIQARPEEISIKEFNKHEANLGKPFGIMSPKKNGNCAKIDLTIEEQENSVEDIIKPILNIKKESISQSIVSKPDTNSSSFLMKLQTAGDICFSCGLLGPDGTKRYLGKWCKRGQSKSSAAMEGTTTSSADLIAVGSDGRGGRIKVLRSVNHPSSDDKEISVSAKRSKLGGKASSLQSPGYLQIEHFFGRASK